MLAETIDGSADVVCIYIYIQLSKWLYHNISISYVYIHSISVIIQYVYLSTYILSTTSIDWRSLVDPLRVSRNTWCMTFPFSTLEEDAMMAAPPHLEQEDQKHRGRPQESAIYTGKTTDGSPYKLPNCDILPATLKLLGLQIPRMIEDPFDHTPHRCQTWISRSWAVVHPLGRWDPCGLSRWSV